MRGEVRGRVMGMRGRERRRLYPQLVGKDPTDFSFDNDFKIAHTIGNYWPYATTLYDYINRTMPLTAPGSLSAAGDLRGGGVPAGGERSDRGRCDDECAERCRKVKMPAHDHFVPDDRTGGTTFK